MSAPHARQRLVDNRLLAALPPRTLEHLQPHLEAVTLSQREIIFRPSQPISSVYFPITCVASLVTIMEDGAAAEIATVGNEGMVGLPVFLGTEMMHHQVFAQVPGTAFRMEAGAFKDEADRSGPLTNIMHRYVQALFNQVAQTAACNRLHPIEQRCARWLLMTHDRVASDQFPLTQEFLSQMLGVRRASVSTIARLLQQAGLIRYRRGRITVLDRHGLESASCECYGAIRAEYERLLSLFSGNR